MTVRQRDLSLVVVRCCSAYVVALEFPVPTCSSCGLTPQFERTTLWYLGIDED